MINIDELSGKVQGVIDGDLDPKLLMIEIVELEKLLKASKSEIEGAFFEDINKYTEKEIIFNDYKIGKRNGSRSFSFKHLLDWRQAESKKRLIEIKYRNAWSAAESGLGSFDENGEIVDLPKVTYSKDSFTLTPIK